MPATPCTCIGHLIWRDGRYWRVDVRDPACPYPHKETLCAAS